MNTHHWLKPATAALVALFLLTPVVVIAAPPRKVACVGDSITWGYGVFNRDTEAYPAQLARLIGPGYQVRNFGRIWATVARLGDSPYLGSPEAKAARDWQADLVILQFGTNDSKSQNWLSAEQFMTDFSQLVGYYRQSASQHQAEILVCLPPPLAISWLGLDNQRLQSQVIPALRQACQQLGLKTIDLYSAFKGKPELYFDGIHPNSQGAEMLARCVAAVMASP